MKNLLAIFILLSTILMRPSEYISIEHVGISDKPIKTIIISRDKFVHSDTDNFIVKNEDYVILKGIIFSYERAEYKGSEFGSFKIKLKNGNKKDSYYYLNRLKSLELFNKLIKVLKESKNTNKELLSRLEVTRKRLVY